MLTITHKIEHECTHNDTQRIYDVDMSKSMYENLLIQWGWQRVGETWESGYSETLSDGSTQYVCEIITIEEKTEESQKPQYHLYVTEWENGHRTVDVYEYSVKSHAEHDKAGYYKAYKARGYTKRVNSKDGSKSPTYFYDTTNEPNHKKATNSICCHIVKTWENE